jgi:hypothetical protein
MKGLPFRYPAALEWGQPSVIGMAEFNTFNFLLFTCHIYFLTARFLRTRAAMEGLSSMRRRRYAMASSQSLAKGT